MCTRAYVKCFLRLGNYLQFAEKANLSLSVVLKLHYTAGAAYREARSTSFLCMSVCLYVVGIVGKALLPVC